MNEAEKIVESLSDVQAVAMMGRLNAAVFSETAYAEVQAHLVTGIEGVDVLSELDAGKKKLRLGMEDSVRAAKLILGGFAKDADLGLLLVDEWEKYKNEKTLMSVEPILYLGLVANLTLILATTEVEYRRGNFKFRKRAADAKLLKAIIDPIAEIVKKCFGS